MDSNFVCACVWMILIIGYMQWRAGATSKRSKVLRAPNHIREFLTRAASAAAFIIVASFSDTCYVTHATRCASAIVCVCDHYSNTRRYQKAKSLKSETTIIYTHIRFTLETRRLTVKHTHTHIHWKLKKQLSRKCFVQCETQRLVLVPRIVQPMEDWMLLKLLKLQNPTSSHKFRRIISRTAFALSHFCDAKRKFSISASLSLDVVVIEHRRNEVGITFKLRNDDEWWWWW